jgi:hypothetical protein
VAILAAWGIKNRPGAKESGLRHRGLRGIRRQGIEYRGTAIGAGIRGEARGNSAHRSRWREEQLL